MLFIIDFDGTVAPTDTVDALLETFADPDWLRIEQEWVEGRINSRQCMSAQLALISADELTLRTFLESVMIDPAFAEFVRYVSPFSDLAIVSDGLDYPIVRALRKGGISIPVYANRTEFRQHGVGISFPFSRPSCTVNSGVCKCSVAQTVDAGRGLTSVLIGDGRSDQCVAHQAGFVFAKGSLITYCRDNGIPHTPFQSFADVLTAIRAWPVVPQFRAKEKQCPLVVA
ncbi:MAG: 2-hydroxy-3-keto-5-methylthiopentenyl-phosphate phosphatase [Thermoanaerobaculia bacterium]|jgi:2-hydroxy-3-keto-5-methylthiopentenyl-1-phosphate phosphatase|nr:2-hydroxy-3-keto-5-methylthiopentenyl-phosphate phosphatase [Thermoanaerobaculia bacterium]